MRLFKSLIKCVLVIFLLVCLQNVAAAQFPDQSLTNQNDDPFSGQAPSTNSTAADPQTNQTTPDLGAPDPGPTPTPLDGGVSILLAAGVAYGAKKYKDQRKRK